MKIKLDNVMGVPYIGNGIEVRLAFKKATKNVRSLLNGVIVENVKIEMDDSTVLTGDFLCQGYERLLSKRRPHRLTLVSTGQVRVEPY